MPSALFQLPNHLTGFHSENYYNDGYVDMVMRYISQKYYNIELKGELNYVQTKNKDFHEVSLVVNDKTVLKCARVNGLRNIQNIVNKLKV